LVVLHGINLTDFSAIAGTGRDAGIRDNRIKAAVAFGDIVNDSTEQVVTTVDTNSCRALDPQH